MIRNREIFLASKSNDKEKEEVKSHKPVIQAKEEKLDLSIDQEDSVSYSLPSISFKQEKEEKRKRHEEAEKQREAQKNQFSSIILNEKEPQKDTIQISDLSIQDAQPTIKDIYHLSFTAKKVDEEIENNTWMFTRENLMMYFEALGCTAADGGKHKKVSLPKATFVFYEGSTIAIMNDFGGALTLPRWDGSEGNGQVPFYLRKQILKAREKLASLKIKANNTTNNTTTNSK